jgi:hypothetical protein
MLPLFSFFNFRIDHALRARSQLLAEWQLDEAGAALIIGCGYVFDGPNDVQFFVRYSAS